MLPTANRNPLLTWDRTTRNDGILFNQEFQALYTNDRYFDDLFSSITTVLNDGTMMANSPNALVTQASVKAYADSKVLNEPTLASNSTTRAASQASIRSYVDTKVIPVLDEDDFVTDSPTIAPSQSSTKAYVDGKIIDEDDFASDSAIKVPTQQSTKAYVDNQLLLRAMPIGSTYIQFPGDTAPSTLWGGTWSNVSSELAGDFIRFEGGAASTFESGNQNTALIQHQHRRNPEAKNEEALILGTDTANVGSGSARQRQFFLDTGNVLNATTNGTETRPVNVTVRKWRRTA